MSNYQPRQTSIPIHFHFAQSKRVVPALKDVPRAASSPLRPKKRPVSIIIPHNAPDHRYLPTAVQPEWTTVEIANYPPQLRRPDLADLLSGYNISPDFEFPFAPRFSYPFRAKVQVAGIQEARRMVEELDGKPVGGRNIAVRMKDMTEKERKEYHIQDTADQIKTSIINTARVYHSDLADAILEVRELVKDGNQFAFLQKRAPVTIQSSPETHALDTLKMGEWEFVAGCSAELEGKGSTTVPRLEALKGLQEVLEDQGVLGNIWTRWRGSRLMVAEGT